MKDEIKNYQIPEEIKDICRSCESNIFAQNKWCAFRSLGNEYCDYILNATKLYLEKDKQLDKYKNVIDKIKEYCNKQIEIAKENITNSEQWLKVEECHLSAKQDIHTGKLIKRENEKILELLEEVE